MRRVRTFFAAAVITGGILVANAGPESRGIIQDHDRGTGRIAIDEGNYSLAPNATIRNLAGGWSGPAALRKGTPVAFDADLEGRISEIVILPEDPETLEEQGYAQSPE